MVPSQQKAKPMQKTLTIGVTGHRDIVENKQLKQDVIQFFSALATEYSTRKIKLLSPLADGADRFVADIFLDFQKQHKAWELIVPMPFSQERYMEDFDEESKRDFLNYIKIAKDIFEVEDHLNDNYKSLGIYVADNSNILLALWDGTFNHKSGGTGDVVKYAQENNKRVVHFVCERGM